MTDRKQPGSRIGPQGTTAKPATAQSPRTGADSQKPGTPSVGSTGCVGRDQHGNPVWDWLKDTGRIAIGGATRILKKLEAPELKIEDTQQRHRRIEPDADPGGGYDPYNQGRKPRKPGR